MLQQLNPTYDLSEMTGFILDATSNELGIICELLDDERKLYGEINSKFLLDLIFLRIKQLRDKRFSEEN